MRPFDSRRQPWNPPKVTVPNQRFWIKTKKGEAELAVRYLPSTGPQNCHFARANAFCFVKRTYSVNFSESRQARSGTSYSKERAMHHESNNEPGKIVPFPRKRSPRLTMEMADEIRSLARIGMMQHDIAAQVGVNQGRVSEVLTGKRFPPREPDLFDNAS